MKLKYILPAICLAFASCAGEETSEKEEAAPTEPKPLEATEPSVDDVSEESETNGIEEVRVLKANIGLYQDQAIMVIEHSNEPAGAGYAVSGYYFYEKIQREIALEGEYVPEEERYMLVELVNGKQTGYMEIFLADHESSFWAVNEEAEKQELNAHVLMDYPVENLPVKIEHHKFTYEHDVEFLTGEASQPTTDVLYATYIADSYMSFVLKVTRTNGHSGSLDGVLSLDGDLLKYYTEIGDSDSDIEMGKRCGMKTVLIRSTNEIGADFRVDALKNLFSND